MAELRNLIASHVQVCKSTSNTIISQELLLNLQQNFRLPEVPVSRPALWRAFHSSVALLVAIPPETQEEHMEKELELDETIVEERKGETTKESMTGLFSGMQSAIQRV